MHHLTCFGEKIVFVIFIIRWWIKTDALLVCLFAPALAFDEDFGPILAQIKVLELSWREKLFGSLGATSWKHRAPSWKFGQHFSRTQSVVAYGQSSKKRRKKNWIGNIRPLSLEYSKWRYVSETRFSLETLTCSIVSCYTNTRNRTLNKS